MFLHEHPQFVDDYTVLNTILYRSESKRYRRMSITTLVVLTLCWHSFVYPTVAEAVQNLSESNKSNMTESDKNLNVDYNGILDARKDNKILIIDIREDSEIKETGQLPGSIHIPSKLLSDKLLNLSNEEFKQMYNREKPDYDTKIIVSCRSGRRGALAQSELLKLGFKNVLNYGGGFSDWQNHQKNSSS